MGGGAVQLSGGVVQHGGGAVQLNGGTTQLISAVAQVDLSAAWSSSVGTVMIEEKSKRKKGGCDGLFEYDGRSSSIGCGELAWASAL